MISGVHVLSAQEKTRKNDQPSFMIYEDGKLIDTGSWVTIEPRKSVRPEQVLNVRTPTLIAANGTKIKIFGKCVTRPRLAGKQYTFEAVIADVT